MKHTVDEFLETLIDTNKSHRFFTDWGKANRNVDIFRDELALLSVLTGSLDPESELRRLLTTYPRINELIPLLSAIRLKKDKGQLHVTDEDTAVSRKYIFTPDALIRKDSNNLEMTITFCKKSGLLSELTRINNYTDYYFGVEVGIDTNARKNRSGTAMEALAEPFIQEWAESLSGRYITQKNFETAAREFGVKVPKQQANKKGDFMVLIGGSPINVEANFFDGGGSKQEIMNSYISRRQDLNASGWEFALITDGLGWRKNKHQVEQGFKRIQNIFNLKMCEQGLLQKII